MKKVVITGCTKGLGLALAQNLLHSGHTIVGCGRGDAPVLPIPSKVRFYFSKVDIQNGEHVVSWAEEVLKKKGIPDILINNAAIMNRISPLWEQTEKEISDILNINIKGTINTIRAFVPAMIHNGSGVIVNLSSGWGRSTSPEVAPYCATKWAIEGLSRAMAQELPPGLTVVALNPGIIDTDMLRSAWGKGASNFVQPQQWAERAAPLILGLTSKDNGKSLDIS